MELIVPIIDTHCAAERATEQVEKGPVRNDVRLDYPCLRAVMDFISY